MAKNPRAIALEIITEVEEGAFLNLALKRGLNGLSEADRRFTTRLCMTTIEHLITIDYIIDWFTGKKRVHKLIRNILRIGTAQICYFTGVPERAAVNECVKLTEHSPKRQLKGFVNAVLRAISEKREEVVFPKREENLVSFLSVTYSYPEWMVSTFLRDFGVEKTEAILQKTGGAATTIRPNCLKISSEELDHKLTEHGFVFDAGKYEKQARYIKNISEMEALLEYQTGELTIQGEASMLAVRALALKEGDCVIDVCAAPGGKSALIYEKKPNRLVSMELHPHRGELMKKNFSRMGVESEIRIWDAVVPVPEYYGAFSHVLIDAPCSALGLVYRKPDIKWLRKEEDLLELEHIQADILETCSRYIAVGGRLVYSTCTMNAKENKAQVLRFLEKHDNFILKDLSGEFEENLFEGAKQGMIQLDPATHGIDGFFIAAMERVK